METFKYSSSQASLLQLIEIEATKNPLIFSEYTKKKERVLLTEIGIKNLIKILTKKQLRKNVCNILLLMCFTTMVSCFDTNANSNLLETMRGPVDFIFSSDPARIMPFFI